MGLSLSVNNNIIAKQDHAFEVLIEEYFKCSLNIPEKDEW